MATIWTLIAMLGASQLAIISLIVHTNNSLGSRIDSMGASLSSRIDALGTSLNSRIDNLSEAFVRHTHSV
jgi:hypothetical protein